MAIVEYIALVAVNAIAFVLIIGGATGGVYYLASYLSTRRSPDKPDWSSRRMRRTGAIILIVGTLGILVTAPRVFGVSGVEAGIIGNLIGAIILAVAGVGLRLRAS